MTPLAAAPALPVVRSRPINTDIAGLVERQVAAPTGSARLRLRTRTSSSSPLGLVDGAWWPHTDDLVAEVGPLLEEVARRGHVVRRVNYSLGAWQPVPRKLHLAGVLVRLSGYRTQPSATIHLVESSRSAPLVLVVVPPGSAPAAAASALELAVTTTALDASALLGASVEPHRSG